MKLSSKLVSSLPLFLFLSIISIIFLVYFCLIGPTSKGKPRNERAEATFSYDSDVAICTAPLLAMIADISFEYRQLKSQLASNQAIRPSLKSTNSKEKSK